jgi:hypothetical protein
MRNYQINPLISPYLFLMLPLLILYNQIKMTSKRPRRAYIEETLANALFDITDNGLSQYRAAQKWGVPQQTISTRLRGQTALVDQIQPQQHLSKD